MTTPTISATLITGRGAAPVTVDAEHIGDNIREFIGCNTFDVVQLGEGLDVFVDDEGAINGSPLNLALTIVAHRFGVPAVLFGNGVIVGFDPTNGDTIGLTVAQQREVTAIMSSKPDAATVERLCESLAPLPGVVALLRTTQ